mgnify:CR=1 FL=1
MKIERKRLVLLSLLVFGCITAFAQKISQNVMQKIYDEVKTPYKYGMVVAPEDNYHKIDCPMVYREGNRWFMTYVVYNGKDGTDGRGYETWLATSDDLLQWKTLGRLLCYADKGWDMNQRAGYPALIDWTWNGSYEMAKYKGRHWMSYFGGEGTGYESVRKPLNMGMASTKGDITQAHPWETSPAPVLSINDKNAQWWEKLTHYKSTVYWDRNKTLGKPFVMFYNAAGINPANQLKAERIGIALSSNMTSWRRLPLRTAKRKTGNPVFFHEAPGIITGDAQIVKFPHYYVMFYFSAFNPKRKYNAYNTFAVSRDLVNWQDWEGADLIYPSKPYDDMFAHKSYVLKHQGVVYHFYCAVNHAGQRGIAVATSVPMGRSQVSFPTLEKKGKRQIMSLNQDWQVSFGKTSEDSITKKMGTFRVNVPNNLDDYYGYRQLKHGNLHGTATYEKHFSVHIQRIDIFFFKEDANAELPKNSSVVDTIERIAGESLNGFCQNEVDLFLFALTDHPQELCALFCRRAGNAFVREDARHRPFFVGHDFVGVVFALRFIAAGLFFFLGRDAAVRRDAKLLCDRSRLLQFWLGWNDNDARFFVCHTKSSFPMICPFLSCKRTVWRVTSTAETALCSSSALSSAVHSNAVNSRRRRSVSYSSLPIASYCSCASLQIRLLAASSSSGWVFRISSNSACVVLFGANCFSGCVMRSGCSASLPSRCVICCSISGVGGLEQTRLSAFCAGVRSGNRCLVCRFSAAASNNFMSTNLG